MTYTATPTTGGIRTETAADSLNRLTRYKIAFTFDGVAQLTAIKRPSSSSADTTIITYNAKGNVQSISNGSATWTYTFSNPFTNPTVMTATRTNPLSHQRVTTANTTFGTLLSVKDELNRTTSFTLDPSGSGRIARVTSPEGNYTEYSYDGRGNVTSTTNVSKTPGTPANIVTSANFTATCPNVKTCNKPNWTIDARGNQTDYVYDTVHGGLLSVTAPAPTGGGVRPKTQYSYAPFYAYYKNSTGTIVAAPSPIYKPTTVSECQTTASCTGGADETKTTTTYGPTGVANNLLPTSVSSGSGDGLLTSTATTNYDAFGNIYTIDGPLSGTADTSRYRFDAVRQLVGVIGPDPDGAGILKHRAVRDSYDLDGQPTKLERGTVNSQSDGDWTAFAPLEAAEIGYDALGRKATEKLTASAVTYAFTQYSYDAEDRLECTAQRMNSAAFGSPPASACILSTEGGFGPDRIAKATYNPANEIIKMQTAYGTTLQADEVTTTYTDNGQTETATDAEGNRTTYEYDGHDRLTKTRYPSPTTDGVSSTTDYEQPTYDAAGNVTALRLRDGQSIALTYDNLNRVTLKNLPGGEPDVSYTYDLLGRMTGAAQPGHILTFDYDALGRQISAEGPMGVTTSQYDLAGRRARLTWPDAFYVTYDYLVTGEVTHIRENGAASGVGVLATYAYDDLGRRTGITRGNGTTTAYTFDPVSRLGSLTQNLAGTTNDLTLGFTYNPASQIATSTRSNDAYAWGQHYNVDRPYAANGLNQLTNAGATALGYDARGNLTGSGASGYGYSSENQLNAASGGVTIAYDPVMRLYQTAGGADGMTKFVYMGGEDMIAEHDVAHLLKRRFVHGPGIDEPIVWYEGAGTADRRWLHADERGSIIAVSNGSGAVTGINSYDEYGIPAASNIGRFQYTGQTWLPEIGMHNYKARIYSPTLGRFMQTDPIGYGDGMPWYNYVGSDPVNGTDPSGLGCNGPQSYGGCGDIVVIGQPFGNISSPHASGRTNSGNSSGRTESVGRIQRTAVPQNEDATGDDIVVTAQRIMPRIGPPPSSIFARPPWWVRPPGWNRNWRWGPSRLRPGKSGQEPRWHSPKGEEWRYHPADKNHPEAHWDYHPGTNPRAPWENRPLSPGPLYDELFGGPLRA